MTTKNQSGITFNVDEVTPVSDRLPTCNPLEAIQRLMEVGHRKALADPTSPYANATLARVEACWNYSVDCVAGVHYHPLVAATHQAYAQHRPLVISPDVIWVTITQGLAAHIRLDPEKYRHLLVKHEGRKTLEVREDDLHRGSPENPWDSVIASLAEHVCQEGGELAEKLVSEFSTTGPTERAVSQITLLDVFQPYFEYAVYSVCGIPSITLEGTPDDWKRLREKLDLLAPFDLDWWLARLRPICNQFARAAAGDIDLKHWQQIYKIREVYGGHLISGWLGTLFPYLKDSGRNPLVEAVGEQQAIDNDLDNLPGIEPRDLPHPLSQVPFLHQTPTGPRAMELIGGTSAVIQEPNGAVRPILGWAVRESAPIESIVQAAAEHHTVAAHVDIWQQCESIPTFHVMADVIRFYQEYDEATIHQGTHFDCRLLPLRDWSKPSYDAEWREKTGWPDDIGLTYFLRLAELADGTEFLIQSIGYKADRRHVGSVHIGKRHDTAIPRTGEKVACSFSDFVHKLLQRSPDVFAHGNP